MATRLVGICIEVEGKLYVTVRERHVEEIVITKLQTSSARALSRRRFHAIWRFRGGQEDVPANIGEPAMRSMSRSVRLLCQPVSAGRRSFHMRFHDGFARKSLAWTTI